MRLMAIFCLVNATAIMWVDVLGLVEFSPLAFISFSTLGLLTALADWGNRLQRDKEKK